MNAQQRFARYGWGKLARQRRKPFILQRALDRLNTRWPLGMAMTRLMFQARGMGEE
jgi:hypothetical protein